MFRTHPDTSPTSTLTNQEYASIMAANAALRQRVMTWLMGIEPLDVSYELPVHSIRTKNRQAKPYSRPEKQTPRGRVNSSSIHSSSIHIASPTDLHNYWSTPEAPAAILCNTHQNLPEYRVPAHVQFRGLNDLPDPHHNPLVTCNPEDLREEYYRLIFLYNSLGEKRQQSQLRWPGRASTPSIQDMMNNIDTSIQRVADAAQYVIDFAIDCGVDMSGFDRIFLRYRCPPLRQSIRISKPRATPEEWIGRETVNVDGYR